MKILVPVDGSKYSMEGVKVALDYAKTKGAEIYLMTVTPYIAGIDLELSAHKWNELLQDMRRRGEDVLKQASDFLKSEGISSCTTLSISTSAADEIVSFAEKEKIDLIIIGSRGLSPSSRFKIGSVASRVARYAPCSVYVVKI